MYTEKAKNAVIIILIILNGIIFLLNMERANAYNLSENQETAIKTVLEQSGITLEAAIIKDFSPRKSMVISAFDFSTLEEMLFKGAEDIQESPDFNKTVKYTEDGRRIVLSADKLTYTAAQSFYTPRAIDAAEARAVGEHFLSELIDKARLDFGFRFIYTQAYGLGYNILFLGEYNGTVIASNYVLFNVDSSGITQMSCSLAVPGELTGTAREIYSSDEALLAFSRELKEMYFGENVRVTDMELVYYLTENAGESSTASPYYMFIVKWDSDDPDMQDRCFVNAYTNVFHR